MRKENQTWERDAALLATVFAFDQMLEENESKQREIQHMAERIEKLGNSCINLMMALNREEYPSCFLSGVIMLPLDAMGRVLRQQKRISDAQETILKLLFAHFHYPFTLLEYENAMLRNRPLKEMEPVMTLDAAARSGFWFSLFSAARIRKYDKAVDEVCEHLHVLIIAFATMGKISGILFLKQKPVDGDAISLAYITAIKELFRLDRDNHINRIDYLGELTAREHILYIEDAANRLRNKSTLKMVISSNDVDVMAKDLMLNVCCDYCLSSGERREICQQMAQYVLDETGVSMNMTTEECLEAHTGKTELAEAWKEMYLGTGNTPGTFWTMIFQAGVEANDKEGAIGLVYSLYSVLIGWEKAIKSQFPHVKIADSARRYILKLGEVFRLQMN